MPRAWGLAFEKGAGSSGFFLGSCEIKLGKPTLDLSALPGEVQGFAEWTVSAPAGARISAVEGTREVRLNGSELSPSLRWASFPADALAPEFERFSLITAPATGHFRWSPADPTPTVHARIVCLAAQTCDDKTSSGQVFITEVFAHVIDESLPTITAAGPLLAGGPISGTRQLTFKAVDAGSGVAKVFFDVDDARTATTTDENGGLCKVPYHAMRPCKIEIDSSFDLDTTALSEGAHKVEVFVEDGAGQIGRSQPVTIDVHNRPLNTRRPALSGSPIVGKTLMASTGQWDGGPSTFNYEWLRCSPTATVGQDTGCAPLPGAEDHRKLVAGDLGSRLVVKVTSRNLFGAEVALSPPSGIVLEPAPQTKITKHPSKKTALRIAKFSFSSDRPRSSFLCKLDKAAFKPCHAPFKRKVKPGPHSFRVKAVNATGVADPTPARFSWRVG
jgi:hypothetical protein